MAEKQHEWYKILRFIIKIHNSIIMLAINFFLNNSKHNVIKTVMKSHSNPFKFLRCFVLVQSAIFNPNWHELRQQEKCSSSAPTRSKFYETQWAWQGVKWIQLMSIFTSKKIWKFLIQIQLTESNPKITRGKSALPHAN